MGKQKVTKFAWLTLSLRTLHYNLSVSHNIEHSPTRVLRADSTKQNVQQWVFGIQNEGGWCYNWLQSVWGGGGGGDGGGGRSCSLAHRCALGASAMAKESVERVLRRRGARRRRLLGVHGRLSWARSEGATVLLSSSASASQGGICSWSMGSRSGMKAGFSMPARGKRGSQLLIDR